MNQKITPSLLNDLIKKDAINEAINLVSSALLEVDEIGFQKILTLESKELMPGFEKFVSAFHQNHPISAINCELNYYRINGRNWDLMFWGFEDFPSDEALNLLAGESSCNSIEDFFIHDYEILVPVYDKWWDYNPSQRSKIDTAQEYCEYLELLYIIREIDQKYKDSFIAHQEWTKDSIIVNSLDPTLIYSQKRNICY